MTDVPLTTCLWFDGNAEEAARFYTSVLPDSRMGDITRAPADYVYGKTGDVLMVEFTLMGQAFVGLNAGPNAKFNEAVSFQIPVKSQEELDRLYAALSAMPEREQCGWIKDRYGVSWQIVPVQMIEYLKGADRQAAARAFLAMADMKRIAMAEIEKAVRG